jgi:hypothetical protein
MDGSSRRKAELHIFLSRATRFGHKEPIEVLKYQRA